MRIRRHLVRSYCLVAVLTLFGAVVGRLDAQQAPPSNAPVSNAPGRLSGTVVGPDSLPVATAAITVRSAVDSQVVSGTLTNAAGKFRIDGLPNGKYLIRVSHLGHQAISLAAEIVPTAPQRDMGVIKLSAQAVEIAAIEGQAEKSAVVIEADRTVYNTKEMPAAAGNAIELLRSVPELEVDMNDKISLRGNQAVAIQINGRPAPMRGDALTNFLKQFPGNRIAKVEVIPNPSAKNDPEGMGGILNLILKENIDLGLSGSVSGGGTSKGSRNTSGRVNYQKGRFTLFAGGNYYWSDNDYDTYDLRENLLARPITFFEQTAARTSSSGSTGMDLTSELRIGKQATLYTSLWAYGYGFDSDGVTHWGILDENRAPMTKYDRDATTESDNMNGDVTLGFKQVFQPQRHELTVDVRRTFNRSSNLQNDEKIFLDLTGDPLAIPSEMTIGDGNDRTNEVSLQADYIRPWGEKGRLSMGIRTYGRLQDNDREQNVFTSDDPESILNQALTAYGYDEYFQSAYTTASRPFGALSVQLGLRAELAQTTFKLPLADSQFSNDYNSIFPSLNLSYDLKKGRTARLNFSRRIGRPYPYILNPDNVTTDPLNRYIGNPKIRPNYTNSVGLDFSKIGSRGTIRVAPYYRKTVDNWDQIRTVDSIGVSTLRWENTTSIQTLGSNVTFSIRPTGKVSGSASVNAYREKRDADNISSEYSRTSMRWSANSNMGYKVSKTLTVSGNGYYMPAQNLVQGRTSGMLQTSLGLRQQLWGTKGSMSLYVQDPFDLYHYTFTTADRTHNQSSRTNTKVRQANLSFTYNFGKPPQQNSRRQEGDAAAPGSVIR